MTESNKTRLNVNISKVLMQDLNELADELGISKTALVNIALKTYVDQQEMLKLSKLAARKNV